VFEQEPSETGYHSLIGFLLAKHFSVSIQANSQHASKVEKKLVSNSGAWPSFRHVDLSLKQIQFIRCECNATQYLAKGLTSQDNNPCSLLVQHRHFQLGMNFAACW
jgi:hypothetical protein